MLCYRTWVYLEENVTKENIWSAFCKWRDNSKNTSQELKKKLKDNISFPLSEKYKIETKKETVEIIQIENRFALKLIENQSNKKIETSIVMNSVNGKLGLSYEMEMTTRDAHDRIPFSPTKFFSFIEAYLKKNAKYTGALKADEIGIEALSKIILEESQKYQLPLIYVSCKKDGSQKIDCEKLGRMLFCSAFVVYENNVVFSKRLAERTNGRSPYNGAVGIFWKNRYRILTNKESEKEYFQIISKYLVTNPLPQDLTFTFIQEKRAEQLQASSERAIKKLQDELENSEKSAEEKLKAQAKIISEKENQIHTLTEQNENLQSSLNEKQKELEDYVKTFDDEAKVKDDELKALRTENEKLKNECENYKDSFKKKQTTGTRSISFVCNEKDLFPNEIENFLKGILFKYLADRKNNSEQKITRITDIAEDFVKNNPDFDFEKSSSAEMFKQIRTQIKNGEKDLKGFKTKSHNGHIKSRFCDDERYTIIIPSTEGKGNRSNKNLSSDTAKNCFLEVR